MSQKLKEVDRELQTGDMSRLLLIRLKSLRKYTRSSKEDIWVYSLLTERILHIFINKCAKKQNKVDQKLQRQYMSTFLVTYVLKATENTPGAPKGILCIFFIKYVSKVYGSRPGAPKRILNTFFV
jgi:hypothetical protein